MKEVFMQLSGESFIECSNTDVIQKRNQFSIKTFIVKIIQSYNVIK